MNRAAKPSASVKPPDAAEAGFRLHSVGIILGAILIAWPAFLSGFPLMYPDSVEYMSAGRPVAAALLLGHYSSYYGIRSLIYSLGILPLHPNQMIWPIVAFQCLLTSWVLWLVFRSIFPKKRWIHFLILMVPLSLFSSLSWFGSFVMPDILGPDLYLCIFLLVFTPDSLSRTERMLVSLISWWSITAHATHLLIGVVLCCCSLAVIAVFRLMPFRKYAGSAARLATIIALAAGAQIALNTFLYGAPSLNGDRPPFLAARLVADGPARWYLERHCPDSRWELCHYVNNLSGTSNRFLWDLDGVYKNAPLISRELILREEMPLALAVLRAYPREQIRKTASNFVAQLSSFDLQDFKPNPDILIGIQGRLPKEREAYIQSRQARDGLALDFFYRVHQAGMILSLAGIAVLLPWLLRSRQTALIALGFVTAVSLVANALLTGTLSMVAGRYQSRVLWLLPFCAALCLFKWATERRKIIHARTPAEEVELTTDQVSEWLVAG